DLITDQLLSMVKRQQLDPFTMMAASYGSPDKDLSSAYFHNPAHFVQYDAASGGFNDISEDEHYRFISSQMAKADTCAMCEGFKSCKSFLAPYVAGDYDKCRGFYRNFLDAYDIKKTKEETKKKSETGL
ncbi:MAG: hypothetical protein LLG37_09800, partial [Spirochaetia bacterium]|nr:hypothetical protein [Spirochaetia bacterium]